VQAMKIVQATEAKNNFGKLLEDALVEPVTIQKNGREIAVILSFEEFKNLTQNAGIGADVRTSLERSIKRWDDVYRALAK
jgi:prevent-host-death family protein